MTEVQHNHAKSFLSAIRWIDSRLVYAERRAEYRSDPSTGKVMFGLDPEFTFTLGDPLRNDVEMARHFGELALLANQDTLNLDVMSTLKSSDYTVNGIVCVGDSVSSWFVTGKHFLLEIKNSRLAT